MKKYMILWIAVFGICSCENFLDVKPKSEILGDKLFETAEGFEDALYGVYTHLGRADLYGKMLSWYMPDLLAAYYVKENVNTQWQLLLNFDYTNNQLADRKIFDNIWIQMYENIGYVNDILRYLDEHNDMRYHHFYKGEALGLRAFMHLELCNCFAPAYREDTRDLPAIPYYERYEPLVQPFRTLEAVYRKVTDELQVAEALLAEEGDYLTADRTAMPGAPAFMTQRQFHMNLYAVQALLARTYLMKNDLDSAMIYAEKVIASGKFSFADKTNLAHEYASCISENETIWAVYPVSEWTDLMRECFDYAQDDMDRAMLPLNGFWVGMFGVEGWAVDYGFQTLYQVPNTEGRQDFRYNAWFRQREGVTGKHRRFYKIYRNTGEPDGQKGIHMIRIPEMYLIMAEGLLKKGDTEKAREYFDTYTRARGFYYKEEEAVFDMDLINKEYRKEFFGEGREWFNRKRQNLPFYSCMYSLNPPYPEGTDAKYTWPVPDDEFEYREGGREGVYPPRQEEEQTH